MKINKVRLGTALVFNVLFAIFAPLFIPFNGAPYWQSVAFLLIGATAMSMISETVLSYIETRKS